MKIRWLLVPATALVVSACSLPGQKKVEVMPTPTPVVQKIDDMQSEKPPGVMVGGAAMLPTRTLTENAMLANNITTFVVALRSAKLDVVLNGKGPYTVFAPTNAAFDALPAGTLSNLLKPASAAQLKALLENHVVMGTYNAADLKDGMTLKTLGGNTLTVSAKGGKVMINGVATAETADAQSSNGVTHVVTAVLSPSK